MLEALGIKTVGIDPTEALIRHARQQDPEGDYRIGRAEALDFPGRSYDLVISYLTLIDIPDIRTAIAEMCRVLEPGGTLLIANLTSFNTAGQPNGWVRDADGSSRFCIDHYMEEHADWVRWHGIRVHNWHRPLSTYIVPAAGPRPGTASLRRANAGRRRPSQSGVASARALLPDHGVAEARRLDMNLQSALFGNRAAFTSKGKSSPFAR